MSRDTVAHNMGRSKFLSVIVHPHSPCMQSLCLFLWCTRITSMWMRCHQICVQLSRWATLVHKHQQHKGPASGVRLQARKAYKVDGVLLTRVWLSFTIRAMFIHKHSNTEGEATLVEI
ncbi:hypothetical protein BaRGS_00004568 [Batillaria attramentaria]|uniref:Uncharacterized protein n=1 Tax=Batillaria attramentaria TaxID=370345 RepID=A0ABD0LZ33_9CAEN